TVVEGYIRASINLSLGEEWTDEALERATTLLCGECGTRFGLGALVVVARGGARPAPRWTSGEPRPRSGVQWLPGRSRTRLNHGSRRCRSTCPSGPTTTGRERRMREAADRRFPTRR